ncbi:S-adenosyl-L-methionine-dependent methyltransferase [Suhomyces tanzawaensis NRRL Y-17324]|uniref:S-adenosyl-L-methionine-dependent methyltransferase n=1 Tax=Suhomyces tanzawaensis NRRL Y-17324 TaxID=984487 RepID=A0A1E4SIB6_9ASCO|nr:S-adenosyl-L-methionine-dependent methyltransferase [Suhomyces tanzawaensis NRRL Y-17324]ODV79243.1 S-adenosyl-L-methionine-dependent methyltransferase [Suhomyces tanzawaensis NRRL Y-17324]
MHQFSHTDAIAANNKVFDEDFAIKYENTEGMQVLSRIMAKIVLEFDVSGPRKTREESASLMGDPQTLSIGSKAQHSAPSEDFPYPLIRPGIKLMDFACGTGLFTQRLFPYLQGDSHTEVVGIDISRPFLDSFDKKAAANRSERLSISSYLYDIIDPAKQAELDAKFGGQFDVIVCTISYHHIENYRDVTKKLATFLRPGGWLLILDFYNEDVESCEQSENATNAVRHMGGLKVDSMNDTLGPYSGLINVSSARETRAHLWQKREFIENHLTKSVNEKMDAGELNSKLDASGDTVYLVEVSFILAVGQAGPTNK